MKLQAIIDGQDREFEIAADSANVVEVEPGVYSIVIEGRSYEARVNGTMVDIAGRRYQVEILDPREPRRRATNAGGSGRRDVTAPMPGKVVRVLVQPGDRVRARQPVVVVEAMKMENELRAGREGTVSEVHARDGSSVEAGTLLVVIQ